MIMACNYVTPVSLDVSSLNPVDLEEFLISLQFDATIAAKLTGQ